MMDAKRKRGGKRTRRGEKRAFQGNPKHTSECFWSRVIFQDHKEEDIKEKIRTVTVSYLGAVMSIYQEDEEWENNGEDGGGARLVRLLPRRNVDEGEEVAEEEGLELGVLVDWLVKSFFVSMVTTLSSILWWCLILVELKVTGRTQLQRKPEKEKEKQHTLIQNGVAQNQASSQEI